MKKKIFFFYFFELRLFIFIEKNILHLLLEGDSLFSSKFSPFSCQKRRKIKKNILLFLGGYLFSRNFFLLPVQKKIIKIYSSSPSLREFLYFHRNFLFLPVKKNNKNIFF